MAYLLNTVDLSTYGIIPGQVGGSNIALQGCFDMPARIGDVYKDWGDENGLEIYTASEELFFGGRDIIFEGHIDGGRSAIYSSLQSLYTDIAAASGLSVFSTPYGDFNAYPKIADPTHFHDISKLKMEFREPVVDLSSGSIPSTASDPYMIDGIPMKSFGLYASDYKGLIGLPEMKEQTFTKIEAEGYKINKRNANKVEFSGLIVASSLATFKTNILNLYKLFSSAGERTFTLNNQVVIVGVPLDGFKIDKVMLANFVIGTFKCEITASSIT